ncbi:MAG TPA: neutral/alkaline non-lysosomal ceramidase N-terminal domain-containing protein [Ktedonobacteraceae bacterium]
MGCAGFAKVSLTPPLGIELGGYGVYLQRRASVVHDELFVRALLLEDDSGKRVILLTLDLLGLEAEMTRKIVHRTAEALALSEDHVLVSCTHTHSGPATVSLLGWGNRDPSYTATIPDRCVEASLAAVAALCPVRIGMAHGKVRAIGMNRVRRYGPLDPSLHVVRFDTVQGEPLGVLFSHGCHPVTIDRRTVAGNAISADWPGYVAHRLSEEGYGETLFRLGACGDIDPVVAWHHFGFEGMELSAEVVTQSLLALLGSITTTPELRLQVAQHNVPLPLQPLTEQDIAATLSEAQRRYGAAQAASTDAGGTQPPEAVTYLKKSVLIPWEPRPDATVAAAWLQFYQTWAQTMRASLRAQPSQVSLSLIGLLLNGEAWLQVPGEIFTDLSLQIQEGSPFSTTVVTTLANHFIGYIPDPEDFAVGGYAALVAPRLLQMPPYHPLVGEILVTGAIQLLETLGERI